MDAEVCMFGSSKAVPLTGVALCVRGEVEICVPVKREEEPGRS